MRPMIPLAIPNLDGREEEYLRECVATAYVSSVGPFVSRFESLVADAAGTDDAVATSSGTTGLHAALVAVGVKRDDLVIVPSFTFIASANAVAVAGAEPWLFDVSAETWTIDPHLLAERIGAETDRRNGQLIHLETKRRVAAIMPVYSLGLPADMDRIVDTAGTFGLPVVADAAAALGARYKGRPLGALGADLTVFSFNGNKTITAGGGGAVAGDDAKLTHQVRHLTTTARIGPGYDHDQVGFNYRMTNLQAAVGCAQMEKLDDLVGAKRRISSAYASAFDTISDVSSFPSLAWAESACWLSGVVLHNQTGAAVARLRELLRKNGIDARPFWKPMHLQPPYAAAPRTPQPVCEKLWPTVMPLPCSTNLSEADLQFVIDTVRAALCENRAWSDSRG